MSITPEQAQAIYDEADCLFNRAAIDAVIERMAAEITAQLSDKHPVVMSVMTGAMIPAGQLLTHLAFPLTIDYIHATRYGAETRGGSLKWITEPHRSFEGRVVLIVDDILDEGATLAAIVDYCRNNGASEVYTAVLVEKIHTRKHEGMVADFVGLEVEDRYVFGYGMDYKGYLRNVAGIYAVKDS